MTRAAEDVVRRWMDAMVDEDDLARPHSGTEGRPQVTGTALGGCSAARSGGGMAQYQPLACECDQAPHALP